MQNPQLDAGCSGDEGLHWLGQLGDLHGKKILTPPIMRSGEVEIGQMLGEIAGLAPQ